MTESMMQVLSQNANLADIAQKIENGIRLSFEDGVRLFESHDLSLLGKLAHEVRTRLHGRKAFYAVNWHLNHTNICTARCTFCAFSKSSGERGAYALTINEIETTLAEAVRRFRVNEIHVVGGLNPELDLDYYLSLFAAIRKVAPDVYLKALTAVEIADLAERSGITWRELLTRLKRAGLNGLPGGGAEIFREEIRQKLCSHKASSSDWLNIHRTAHELGLHSNATMLYGHLESVEDRVDHLLRLRTLQDETRGFQAFVPLPFRPFRAEETEHSYLKEIRGADGYADLKMLAVSRLLLDNVPHVRFHWPASDLRMLPVALAFGADDAGGTNFNEHIMREANPKPSGGCEEEKLRALIARAGFAPVLTDSSYKESARVG